MRLHGNTVLVTGGASGIGLALAGAWLEQGNEVIVCARDEQKLQALSDRFAGLYAYRCDVGVREDVEALVARLMQTHKTLNVLVNNAGIQHNYSFTEGADHADVIDEEVGINLVAPLHLTDRLLPHLMKQSTAAVINITSALARVPKQSAPVYCATKAGLSGFSKALRYQLEGTPVKVFEIIPALVDTAMTRGRGRGKISPEALVAEAMRSIGRDRYEIRIGKTKLLYALHRLYPALAERIIRNG